jgi:hypothetical protein
MHRLFRTSAASVSPDPIRAEEAPRHGGNSTSRMLTGNTPPLHRYEDAIGFGFEWSGGTTTGSQIPDPCPRWMEFTSRAPGILHPHGPWQLSSDSQVEGTGTVRVEGRIPRLQQWLPSPAQDWVTLKTVVNVRLPVLMEGRPVVLNPREMGTWHWDDRLQLELNGTDFQLQTITVERLSAIPTLFLCGDSTVTDQVAEPWTGWGQMMPVFSMRASPLPTTPNPEKP